MPSPLTFLATLLAVSLMIATEAHALTLKLATLAPDGTTWMAEMRKGTNEITQRTNGRVKLKFYPGGVMGNDQSVMRKIRVGQLQGGAFPIGSLKEVFTDTQVYGLPFLFRSYEEVDFVRQRVDPLIRQGIERNGFVVLGISEGGFAYMMCKKPLKKVEDLKGQKVWLPEGDVIAETVFKMTGVAPVSLTLGDVYTGLQTGLVDAVGISPMAAIAFQWHTRVSYVTDAPLVLLAGMLVVDKKAFLRLNPADQAVVREVMESTFARLDRLNRQDDAAARHALQEQGVQFITPPPDELTRWHAIADEAIVQLGAMGVYTPDMLETVRRHLADIRAPQ
jgi:TRAP-type C4-dicarboxylate transport system substrate-binding protein